MFDYDFILVCFAVAVAVFAACAWTRLLYLLRVDAIERAEIDRWWRERQAQREQSSLIDDSPSALPETWRAPCGEVVEFPANNDSRGGAA